MSNKWHEERTGMYAVVDDTHLYCKYQGELCSIPHQGIENVRDLFPWLERLNLISAWILPESRLSRQTETFYTSCPEWDCFAYTEYDYQQEGGEVSPGTGENILLSLQGWKKSDKWQPCYYAVFPEYNSSWQPDSDEIALDDCTDPLELYAAIHYLEDQLGVPLKQSPGNVGLHLLKGKVNPRAMFPTVPQGFTDTVTMGHDALWKRLLTLAELAKKYVHCVDKNSAYLSACHDLYMGIGLPILINNPTFTSSQAHIPGVWYVTSIQGSSPFDGIQLPLIASPNTWVWTPSLALLLMMGYEVEIEKAYVWRDYDKVMGSWASHIWNSRQALKHNTPGYKHQIARERAYSEVKVVATRTVGKFKSDYSKDQQYKNGTTDYHPDRWSLILDKTRVRMLLRMYQLWKSGYPAFMVYTDGLYICSDERHPQVHEALRLDSATELGGYKHAYTVRIEDVKPYLSMEKAEMIAAFKSHALQEGER